MFFFSQVTRQVAQCKCAKRFQVEQIGENKYRVRIWSSIVVIKHKFKSRSFNAFNDIYKSI